MKLYPIAERAVRAAPDSPDTLAILGYAQYASDRNRDAIRSWQRSLALRPDAQVRKYLAKAEQDAKVESEFTQKESSHFTLKYEGSQTPESFRRDLVSTLESHYDDLVARSWRGAPGQYRGDSIHRSGFL